MCAYPRFSGNADQHLVVKLSTRIAPALYCGKFRFPFGLRVPLTPTDSPPSAIFVAGQKVRTLCLDKKIDYIWDYVDALIYIANVLVTFQLATKNTICANCVLLPADKCNPPSVSERKRKIGIASASPLSKARVELSGSA